MKKLLFFVIAYFTFSIPALAQTATPISIKLSVQIVNKNVLRVKDLTLFSIYPSSLDSDLRNNYYTVKMFGKNDELLFSGKVASGVFHVPGTAEDEEPSVPKFEQFSEILLYLPYFSDAEKIIFYDENGKVLLIIPLKNYKLIPPDTKIIPLDRGSAQPACDRCGKCADQPAPPTYDQCQACMKKTGYNWTALGCIPSSTSGFIKTLLSIILPIATAAAFLVLLYGGFLYIVSYGNRQKIALAKQLIEGTIGMILLIIFSVLLLRVIGFEVLGKPGFR